MVARFLHYFPQYTLADLRTGAVSIEDFTLLFAGMVDVESPESTEPVEQAVARRVREVHERARQRTRSKRAGW